MLWEMVDWIHLSMANDRGFTNTGFVIMLIGLSKSSIHQLMHSELS